ncbi:MAG: NUDIX hydrolase [Omnitrophica WOR_2 bacterium]
MLFDHFSEEDLARRLAEAAGSIHTPQDPLPSVFPNGYLNGPPRPAGVLIPFLQQDGIWQILFTRRTDKLPEHSGQVAFPGGRSDPRDASPEATALREAYEEIGLLPDSVRLLGRLDTFITNTNYLLTPVAGVITWPFPLKLEVEEVHRVFTIPVAWLADPVNHEIRERQLHSPYPPVPVIYFQPYDGEVLWGVSAAITINLMKILFWDR